MTVTRPRIYLCCHTHFNELFTCKFHSKYRIYACRIPLEQCKQFKTGIQIHRSRKVLIGNIKTSVWFCWMKVKKILKDKRNNKVQRSHTRRNPKGTSHWCVCCCTINLWLHDATFGIQACKCSESEAKFLIIFKKFNIQLSGNVFIF